MQVPIQQNIQVLTVIGFGDLARLAADVDRRSQGPGVGVDAYDAVALQLRRRAGNTHIKLAGEWIEYQVVRIQVDQVVDGDRLTGGNPAARRRVGHTDPGPAHAGDQRAVNLCRELRGAGIRGWQSIPIP